MNAAEIRNRVAESIEVAAGIGGVIALLIFGYFLNLGLSWLRGDVPLLPPGWACDESSSPYESGHGECYPLKGWHFEEAPGFGRIAVHDVTYTIGRRQLDIDTAEHWANLSNDERQKILDGKATIYDFFEPETSK